MAPQRCLLTAVPVVSGRRSTLAYRMVPESSGKERIRAAAAWLPKGVRTVKEQLLIILEAIRAAQCTLGRCRQPNVTVEQLRDILCNARVDRAVRALSYDD